MNDQITIELKHIRFFGYHGVYPQEKKEGGEFEVNLSLSFHPVGKKINSLDETVNYENLFELLKTEMQTPRELLETLAMEIIERIHEKFSRIKKAKIEIVKLKPPIEGLVGNVATAYSKEF